MQLQTFDFDKPIPKEELDEYERDTLEASMEDMLAKEKEWDAKGVPFYWITPSPYWINPTDWHVFGVQHCDGHVDCTLFSDPVAPTKRLHRFSLIGGGQIVVVENWDWLDFTTSEGKHYHHIHCDGDPKLRVTAHTDDGVKCLADGYIRHVSYEMSSEAVTFKPGTPQDIVDRVGCTFAAMSDDGTGPDLDRILALLDGSTGCAICGRPLRDEISKLIGVGPTCAKQYGVPHSMAAASKRLQLRKQILGTDV
jgi:hypothetical protein